MNVDSPNERTRTHIGIRSIVSLIRLVSLRHVVASPLRSLLLCVSVALGVSSFVGTNAASNSILSAFEGLARDVGGKADLIVDNAGAGVDTALVEPIAGVKGVAHAAGTLEIVTTTPLQPSPILVLGLDFFADRYFMPMRSLAGEDVLDDPLAFANDPWAVLATEALAQKHGLKPGSEITLTTPKGVHAFHVRGVLAGEGVAQIFGGDLLVMLSDAAELAFDRPGKFDRILVALNEPQARASIEAIVRDRASVGAPQQRTQGLVNMIAPMRQGLGLAGLVALLVGALLVYAAASVAVARRKRELGTLRALGATPGSLIATLIAEIAILALVGSVLGLPAGRAIAASALQQTTPSLSRFYAPVVTPPPVITVPLALAGIAIGVLISVGAAWIAARHVAQIDPVEALRRMPSEPRPARLRSLAAFGLVLVLAAVGLSAIGSSSTAGAALFFLMGGGVMLVPALLKALHGIGRRVFDAIFGVPGVLAVDYTARHAGRSATTAAALLIGIATSVCMGSWAISLERSMFEWIDRALPSDLYVTAGSPVADERNVPFAADNVDKLHAIEGIAHVRTSRQIAIELNGARTNVMGFDAAPYYERCDPTLIRSGAVPIDGAAMAQEPRIVLAENAARRLDVKVGDTLKVRTPKGERAFKVHATIVDYTSDQGIGFIDHRWLREWFDETLVDTISIDLKPGATRAAVTEAVRATLGKDAPLFVLSAADMRGEIRAVLKEFLGVFHAIDLIALVVAALGVASAMITAVADRVRDIAVLRVIGGGRGQVALWIAAEAAYVALVAAIGGALLGVPMGYVFVTVLGAANTGWHVSYVFPVADAAIVALGCIVLAAAVGAVVGTRAAQTVDFADTLRMD